MGVTVGGSVSLTHLDAAGDDPAQARAQIKTIGDRVNDIAGKSLAETGASNNFDTGEQYFTGGNVGIGTSSPGSLLDVDGDAEFDSVSMNGSGFGKMDLSRSSVSGTSEFTYGILPDGDFSLTHNNGTNTEEVYNIDTDRGHQIGNPTGGSQGSGTLNAEEVYDNGNRVAIQPGNASSPALSLGSWRQPNASRSTLVTVNHRCTGDGANGEVQIDESGGTTADYDLNFSSNSSSEADNSTTFIVPAGGQYRVVENTSSVDILEVLEWTL
jgi:hypothetical protein